MKMSESVPSISQKLHQEKLEGLKVITNLFNPILQQISEPSVQPKTSLQILLRAIDENPSVDIVDRTLVENLKYVLQNFNDDPSISFQLLLAWNEQLKQEIQFSVRRCNYSYLHGSLLSEWFELEEKKSARTFNVTESDGFNVSNELIEKVISPENEAIDKFKTLMFTDDFTEKIRKDISEELLSFEANFESQNVLKTIRERIEKCFPIDDVSQRSVYWCVKGLMSNDLLSSDQKTALEKLSKEEEVLDELASNFTDRLRNLCRWEWPSSCEIVQMRRGLAGEYKPFMNEDIITALFLQYIVVEWAAGLKEHLSELYNSKVWIKPNCNSSSIESERCRFHESILLSNLPTYQRSQDSKPQGEYVKVEASDVECGNMFKGFNQICSSQQTSKSNSAIDFKQTLLHVLKTEIRLNQVLHPDKPLIVVQADVESFESYINHDAILTVLKYLGVPLKWLEFFKKFLQPKVCFVEGEEPKTIVRGVPTSHALSSLFSETLMFILEYIVNQTCNGMRIYRIDSELWFWSNNQENVKKVWETMTTYGEMVGLKIKENRSGSVTVFSDEIWTENPIEFGPHPLPQKNVRWGFLQLYSNGTFIIDQQFIKKFLLKIHGLLDKSECVLELINVFNEYLAFFIRNVGRCAVVSGKQHLDQIISSLQMIYLNLFGLENENPVDKLKDRFDQLRTADVMDAWVYWPLEKGGLGLVNPFIGVMALRETFVNLKDDDHFTMLPLQDNILWDEMEIKYKRDNSNKIDILKLPTWTEYLGKRETECNHWSTRYLYMLDCPAPKTLSRPDRLRWMNRSTYNDEVESHYFKLLHAFYKTHLVSHLGSKEFINLTCTSMPMFVNIKKNK